MKLISQEKLPKEKRSSAGKEELLSCLEELEDQVLEMIEDPLYDTFDALKQFVLNMNKSIRDENPSIKSDEKDIDRVLKYTDRIEDRMKGMMYCLEKGTKRIKAEEKDVDISQMGASE